MLQPVVDNQGLGLWVDDWIAPGDRWLREIGFPANRRLSCASNDLDHDPITGINVLHTVTDPITTKNGTRVPGLRLGQQRSHACSPHSRCSCCNPTASPTTNSGP